MWLALLLSSGLSAQAQMVDLGDRLGRQDYHIDTTDVKTVGLDVDALGFFKDNEFDGNVVKGYSLPGFRLQPRVTYTPIEQIRLEAGFHAQVFDGTNKYPAYVFHDIATWKGNKYQRGAHALPFFRATASLGKERKSQTTIVLGDIYGGTTHKLLLPLYNPELVLTDDPEMGTQIIVDRKHWHSDLWLNWQSYIYEEDTHQEAFTLGWSQRVNVRGAYFPVQLLIQHRGGEQDVTNLGVQTIANGAIGAGYEWKTQSAITAINVEADALFAYQQHGSLWPFDFGSAAWACAGIEVKKDLHFRLGYFLTKDFCSLYGSPFFGTLSTKYPGARFDRMGAGYWSVEYGKTFANAYTVGAKANGYLSSCGKLSYPDGTIDPARFRHTFSFGVYLRACPSFILKSFKK